MDESRLSADEAIATARRLIDEDDGDPWELIQSGLDVMGALVAEVKRLRAENATLRKATDAAVDGVRAMLPAALEIARREGAEAMALRAEAACDGVARRFAELHASQWSDRRRAASGGACEGADDCAAAIRALPLDAGGES